MPGECPTGRRSLAGGPRHTPARLGTCWEAARTPHTQHAETLPWRRALRDPWDGAGVMDDMEVDLSLGVDRAREFSPRVWELTGALDVLAGSARAGAVVASFGLDGIAIVQLTEDQLHENHPRNGDANRTTQFSELPTCHAVSSPPLWGELS